jgi:hypothetical protein
MKEQTYATSIRPETIVGDSRSIVGIEPDASLGKLWKRARAHTDVGELF